MLVQLLLKLFKLNFKDNYYQKIALFSELVASLLGLTIYWYTSKAFAPAIAETLTKYHTNYFTFMVIGEVFLYFPIYFMEGFSRKLRMSMADGTFETLLSLPVSPIKTNIVIGIQGIARELARLTLFITLAALCFGLRFDPLYFAQGLLLQIAYLPVFLGLGLLISSVVMITGRGNGLVAFLNTGASLLAGGYFPIEVFPNIVQKLALKLSPFTAILQSTREILIGKLDLNDFLTPVIWSVILLPSGIYLFKWAIINFKRKGIPLIFTSS
ncbi:MAG: ABC transporter permease [Halobacteriovoraceae bacterium]|jgi:ABC-2 type transport system permease protein|nr:ABC transporter permease [Halobacteriovoraceae bacterium]MBT5094011.1 ABC transporter permease [Halobacteriovoraceae bacterium]